MASGTIPLIILSIINIHRGTGSMTLFQDPLSSIEQGSNWVDFGGVTIESGRCLGTSDCVKMTEYSELYFVGFDVFAQPDLAIHFNLCFGCDGASLPVDGLSVFYDCSSLNRYVLLHQVNWKQLKSFNFTLIGDFATFDGVEVVAQRIALPMECDNAIFLNLAFVNHDSTMWIDTFSITVPTMAPTLSPSLHPTTPSLSPTTVPTATPTESTQSPSHSPSHSPSPSPTMSPSVAPTAPPTVIPSPSPSESPSDSPSHSPSDSPSHSPSSSPSIMPSNSPSISPSNSPSMTPSATPTTRKPTSYFNLNLITDRVVDKNEDENRRNESNDTHSELTNHSESVIISLPMTTMMDIWSEDRLNATEPVLQQEVLSDSDATMQDDDCPMAMEMGKFVAWSVRKWWMVYAAVFSLGFIVGSSLLAVVVVMRNRHKKRGGRIMAV